MITHLSSCMLPLQRGVREIARAASALCKSTILYVDRGVVVVNKPPGLVCQGVTFLQGSSGAIDNYPQLLNARSSSHYNGAPTGLGQDEDLDKNMNLICVLHPVHRLDKGTTGSLVFARSTALARELSKQFQQRTVEKTYLALVRGGDKSFPGKSGQIRAALQFIDGRTSLGTPTNGKHSATDWELVGSSPNLPLSLVRLKLLTGYKHQLRVHMAHCLQAPILGDTLHSRSQLSDSISRVTSVPPDRIFLHASQLSILRYKKSGPNKRFRLTVRAPLPKDFLKLCSDTGIEVDPVEAGGGVFVNGVLLEEGEQQDLDDK